MRDVILCMEDHDEKRRNLDPETWNLQKLFIVDFIQKVMETLNLTSALGIWKLFSELQTGEKIF